MKDFSGFSDESRQTLYLVHKGIYRFVAQYPYSYPFKQRFFLCVYVCKKKLGGGGGGRGEGFTEAAICTEVVRANY